MNAENLVFSVLRRILHVNFGVRKDFGSTSFNVR